jgi:hypothetical protein
MTTLINFGLFAMIIAGIWLLRRGIRGRALDDHPICRQCRFDLFNRAKESNRCPECGAQLDQFGATIIGNRQARYRLVWAGLALLVAGVLPLGSQIGLAVSGVDPMHLKPTWWLLRELPGDKRYGINGLNTGELQRRLLANQLSLKDESRLVQLILGFQQDLSHPWDPRWGDMIEWIHNRGNLSTEAWNAYIADDQPGTLEVRPRVARGEPIVFQLNAELRGSTAFAKVSSSLSITPSVPGAAIEYPMWGGSAGETLGFYGWVELTPNAWKQIQPGEHELDVTVTGSNGWTGPGPHPPLKLSGKWILAPDGESVVTTYRDEALAAQLRQTLSYQIRDDTANEFRVCVKSDDPRFVLAYDIFVRDGTRECTGTTMWATVNGVGCSHREAVFTGTNVPAGRTVDLIMRPSLTAARQTVYQTRVLDHEFVLKNVTLNGHWSFDWRR